LFESELSELRTASLHRQLRVAETPQGVRTVVDGRELINFSSNDYLGLAFHPDVIRGAQKAAGIWGTGAGASRLVSGTTAIHAELEDRLARWVGTEAALVFPSGFQTNLGVIQALAGADDEVYVDRFVHASLVDGARLSGAKLRVYPHRDVKKLEALLAKPFAGKRLILTDSYFSMDGDCAPLLELVKLSEKFGAMLVVDEAHALGVYGDHGRGLLNEKSLTRRVTAIVGTLSKSLGSQGGFVAGSAELKDFLINKARAFIYTTGVSPTLCGAALAALNIVEKTDAIRDELWGRVDFARTHLRALGLDLGDSEGPIIPVILGDTRRTLAWADELREAGILGVAIRPPTVPKGTDRIRLTVTAKHTADDIRRLTAVLQKLS
jgi:glycine C-acetyltransferase/8-amino-7-oxononanoate synthase